MILRGRTEGEVLSIRFEGDDVLDYGNASAVKQDLLARIDGDADLVIDLSAIEFIDSAGLGVLVGAFKTAHVAGRRLLFAGVRSSVLEIMSIIRLDEILELSPNVPAAMELLRRAG